MRGRERDASGVQRTGVMGSGWVSLLVRGGTATLLAVAAALSSAVPLRPFVAVPAHAQVPSPSTLVSLAQFDATGLLPLGTSTGEAAHHILPAGFTFKHSHGGTVWIYIMSGSVQIIDDSGTKTYGPGAFFYEPPNHVLTAHAVTQVELFALQFLSPGAPATTAIEGPNIPPDRTSLLTFSSTNLLPQTPATAYASITTTPAGVTYKHVHGATRFIYVLKGTLQITDSNGTIVYHPGDFYIEHAGDTIDAVGVTTVTVFGLTFLPRDAVDTTPLLTAVPTSWSTPSGSSASFDVNFSSSAPGQGVVYFGTGPGCSGLVETALSDAGAGTKSHTVHVTGNDLPGTVGDNGLIPGQTYYFKTVTLTGGLTEVDDNNGSCYTVTIAGP